MDWGQRIIFISHAVHARQFYPAVRPITLKVLKLQVYITLDAPCFGKPAMPPSSPLWFHYRRSYKWWHLKSILRFEPHMDWILG